MNDGKDELATRAATMAVGVREYLGSQPTLLLEGQAVPPADVAAKLEGFAKLRKDADDSKAAYETALQAANAQIAAMIVYLALITRFVRAAFGNVPDVLIAFGIKPIKPRKPLTADEVAAAVAKREATRQARHTMGSRQKAAIHGDVTGVTVTPIVAPQAQPVAPAATPAPAADPAEPAAHTK